MRRSVPQAIREVVLMSLATTGLACGTTSSAGEDAGASAQRVCTAEQTPAAPSLAGIRPDVPLDFIGFRAETARYDQVSDAGLGGDASDAGVDNMAWSAAVSGGVGEPCRNATDPVTCAASLAALRLLPTTPEGCRALDVGQARTGTCTTSYIVATRGNQIIVPFRDGWTVAFGRIDTRDEAMYVAVSNGWSVRCDVTEPGASGYRLVSETTGDATGTCQGTARFEVEMSVSPEGNLTEVSRKQVECLGVGGRRPHGLIAAGRDEGAGASDLGSYFARAAYLEAASVPAFAIMHQELAQLGASAVLLERIARAERDEVGHASQMTKLARRYGREPQVPELRPLSPRSAFEIALENATEGCIRVTFGAVVAAWQSERANDECLRAILQEIARDEAEHAALAWDVAAFLAQQLTASERAQIADAQAQAIQTLSDESAVQHPQEVVGVAGMPTAAQSASLLDACKRAIFRA